MQRSITKGLPRAWHRCEEHEKVGRLNRESILYELFKINRNGIFFQRMVSPIGRNAQWCCDSIGITLNNMHGISKDSVFRYVYSALPDWVVTSVSELHELLSKEPGFNTPGRPVDFVFGFQGRML